jgi:uncharacterized lipoprotein YmbA
MNLRNLLLVALVMIQTACSLGAPSKPSNFYVLSPAPGTPVAGREAVNVPLSVAVGPVTLPDIFDRPQIVTRPDANRVQLAEFDRWGGDLNEDLLRVLTQNLMGRLNTENVATYPWQGPDRPVYQVALRFFHFDGELGKRAYLSGIWELLDGRDDCQLAVRRFAITQTPPGPDYAAFVQALSEGLATLSQEIATAIVAAKPGCS